VFESSVYLINRMPTLVLQNQSLFECLFNRIPDYDFLRSFGCLCFSFLRLYHAHKLDFRSSPCVFLGYSSSHLGYRCLDLVSQCIYVSRHVHFYKNVFPLAESEQIAQPTTTHLFQQLCHTSCPIETTTLFLTPFCHHTTITQPYLYVTICMF